jgi:hypothetical protein
MDRGFVGSIWILWTPVAICLYLCTPASETTLRRKRMSIADRSHLQRQTVETNAASWIARGSCFIGSKPQQYGRAIAEAVSCWLPTVASRVWQVGFVVDEVASGQVFSEYFGFPCQNRSFHQLLYHYNQPGQLAETLRWADHPSKESCRLS